LEGIAGSFDAFGISVERPPRAEDMLLAPGRMAFAIAASLAAIFMPRTVFMGFVFAPFSPCMRASKPWLGRAEGFTGASPPG
jgi:hypothetical protein